MMQLKNIKVKNSGFCTFNIVTPDKKELKRDWEDLNAGKIEIIKNDKKILQIFYLKL